MLLNEEEIRGQLLLPYLQDLGFDASEISLEKSFSVRLGRSQHMVKNNLRGRSDILCKRNGKNLFIIELKNDSISIDENDINQGISYARLLEDIAPFTIITNGKTTRVFDSITRKELTGTKISGQSSFWENGCTLSTDVDLRIRYEALKNFVSFSQENLKRFCEGQVRDRMGPIIGNIDNPYSKFVKELYIQRQDLQSAFIHFMNAEAFVFGIVGAAGVGKTSAMCSLALQSLENNFVFFYNAAIINKSPLEHIARDLNGKFSSRSESDIVLKKLNELGRFLNKSVLIFIDGIDESVDPNISLELSEMALTVRYLSKVKICISCKSNIWKNFLSVKDTNTHLFEEINKFHDVIPSLENTPGFLLEDFSMEELKSIIPLYKSTFGFKGEISEALLNELRNGFFLRIFSEVYSQKQIPTTIDDKALISRYINKTLEKTNVGAELGLRILSKIGEVIIIRKYNSIEVFKKEGVEVQELLDKLQFSIDDNLPEDLFARNILIKSNKKDSYNISFYYSKIRDYIICYHSYKLDKLNDEEFYNILGDFFQNHIGKSAIAFYLENARTSHKNSLIKFKKDKSLNYVLGYNSYLENNFKTFKGKFNPNTDGDIGIVLPEDLIKNDGYALFPLVSSAEERLIYSNLVDPFSGPYESNLLLQKGVRSVYGSNTSLLVSDQLKVIKKNIFKELKEIIEKGRISSYNSDILLKEKVSLIVYYYYKNLGYDFTIEDYFLPRFQLIYPIDLHNLKVRIDKFRITEYYRRRGVDRKLIKEMVENALKENLKTPKYNVTGDVPPIEELSKIVDILLRKGYGEIEDHYLPYPDLPIIVAKEFYEQNRKENFHQVRIAQFTKEQGLLYITEFFKHLDSCYQEFVEYCFPNLKDEFTFYKEVPHEYFFYMRDSDVLKWGSFGYRPSRSGQFEIHIKDISQSKEAFEKENLTCLRAFSLDLILHIRDFIHFPVRTVDEIKTPNVDEFCVLRNWIYKLLKSDMEGIFEEHEE